MWVPDDPTIMTAQTADFLASVPMFSGLQRDELLKFAELTRERTYPKGSVILFEDDPGDSLFVVRDGRVKVVLVGEDGREVLKIICAAYQSAGEGRKINFPYEPPADLKRPSQLWLGD